MLSCILMSNCCSVHGMLAHIRGVERAGKLLPQFSAHCGVHGLPKTMTTFWMGLLSVAMCPGSSDQVVFVFGVHKKGRTQATTDPCTEVMIEARHQLMEVAPSQRRTPGGLESNAPPQTSKRFCILTATMPKQHQILCFKHSRSNSRAISAAPQRHPSLQVGVFRTCSKEDSTHGAACSSMMQFE
jgi:hypothetical protein